MKVRDTMSNVVLTAGAGTTIAAAASLMSQRGVGSALVMEDDQLIGIFTERDIVRALSQDASAAEQQIAHWMTRDPQTIAPGADVDEALRMMAAAHFRHLPVVDGGRVVGMLSMRDVLRQTVSAD
jgi:CBS domain-containing protein